MKERLSAAARLAGLPDQEVAVVLRNTQTGALAVGQRTGQQTMERRSVASRLIAMADEHSAELFTSDGEAFARVVIGGHSETWQVGGKGFESLLRRWYFAAEQTALKQPDLTDAIATLEAKALGAGESRPVFVRSGRSENAIYLDLGDSTWRAVEVTADGWQIVDSPPVCFRRSRAMLPLPAPVAGGTISELFELVNVPEDSRPLVLGWLVAALRPDRPLPLLAINGEQGCGKTSLTKVLRTLIDPHTAEVRFAPRDDRSLMIGARHSWVLGFDNLSGLPGWLSDVLCCLSTGGAYATRALYSDDGETILRAQRPVILNGIAELATRADLLDRCVALSLPTLPDSMRKSEAELGQRFQDARPRLLGALLDAVACALRRLSETKLAHTPRMADFAQWATAAEPALGLQPGSFLDAYRANIRAASELPLEASAIAAPLRLLLDKQPRTLDGHYTWTGTATTLLRELRECAAPEVTKQNDWPRNAAGLSSQLKRLAPSLRQQGIHFASTRAADISRSRTLTVWRET